MMYKLSTAYPEVQVSKLCKAVVMDEFALELLRRFAYNLIDVISVAY
jgi:hypothetical protein